MKKVLFSIAIAAVALMVASCGEKKLEGEAVDTQYYSLIVPNGWKYNGTNPSKSLMLMKLKEDGKTTEKGHIGFNVSPFNKNAKYHEPNEMRDEAVRRGEVDKGDLKFGDVTYYTSYSEEYNRYRLRTKLANDAILQVEVKDMDFEDPMIKDILSNVTIKETPSELPRDYDCEFFSVTAPEGWQPDPGNNRFRMENEDTNITVYNSTVSFEDVQNNWKAFEKQGEITVGDITWVVYANEKSKLYNVVTDITSEPNKALVVSSFKVKPDEPEFQKVLESIKLKK